MSGTTTPLTRLIFRSFYNSFFHISNIPQISPTYSLKSHSFRYPTDALEAARVDEILEAVEEIGQRFFLSGLERDPTKKV